MTTESAKATRHADLLLALALPLVLLPATASAATPAKASAPMVQAWTMPTQAGSQPDLVTAPDGSLLLSWVEGDADARALRFARFAQGRWTPARTIARGDWFGNAMDTPHILQTADGALWASWMRRTPAGGHARDVVLARSADGGRSWSAPVAVNTDGTATEHGFVSLWPAGRDAAGIAWLDGRAKAGNAGEDAKTMLRSARFGPRLQRSVERVADASVCDCCSTDLTITESGPLLVYRDRAEGELRDIAVTRLGRAGWQAPRRVHADGWVMPACPMNGPAIAARGPRVAAAWYTAPNDRPAVRIALSTDSGASFGKPVELEAGAPVLGRVDTALAADRAWSSWLHEEDGQPVLWLAALSPGDGRLLWRGPVASLSGRGPGMPVPRLVAASDGARLVWTELQDGEPRLRGAHVSAR